MKRTIKNLLTATLCIATMVACTDKNEDVLDDAKILSFGFYVADNNGIIDKDYVIESVTGTAISIDMPVAVDKSKLKAKFTLNEGATAIVNNAAAESSITAIDYNNPVDFFITKGKANARYTITIGKLDVEYWQELPTFNTVDSINSAKLKINPITNEPYIIYYRKGGSTPNQKVGVAYLSAGDWKFLGDSKGFTERADNYDLTFDANGTPYTSFSDYSNIVADKATELASVMKYNGTTWSYVGNKGITAAKVSTTALTIDKKGNPMLATIYGAAGGAISRRNVAVYGFNGTAWNYDSSFPRSATAANTIAPLIACTAGDCVYLAVLDYGNKGSFSVYKHDGSTWTVIGDAIKDDPAFDVSARILSMCATPNGDVFVGYAESNAASKYNIMVKKYTATTNTWATLGDVYATNDIPSRNLCIGVNKQGVPYLLYLEKDNANPMIMKFDLATQTWGTPHTLSTIKATDLYLAFDKNGAGYVSYLSDESGNQKVYLHKF